MTTDLKWKPGHAWNYLRTIEEEQAEVDSLWDKFKHFVFWPYYLVKWVWVNV